MSGKPDTPLAHLKPAAEKGDRGASFHFTEQLCCMPLEEIDTYHPGKTYCVITKVFSQFVVHRFTTDKTLFLFSPLHPLRMWSVYLQTDLLVQYVVTLGIVANCVMLTSEHTYNPSKYAFFCVFFIELLVRCISRGIVLHPHSILRIPWRWLDVISMIGSTLDIVARSEKIGIGTSLFRTFRLIHILKTISIIPGLKVVISGLLRSLKMVTDMFFITLCLMILFSLLGKMVFEDVLSNKCVRNGTNKYDKQNWAKRYHDQYEICGFSRFANGCPANYTCQMAAGGTPYDGLIGFDTIGSAMFTVWRILTLDGWEEFYLQAISSKGPSIAMYFVLLIFLGSFFLMNLPIAMVISSYATEVNIALEEQSKSIPDVSYYRNSSEFFYNPSKLTVRIYDPHRKPARLFRRMAAVEQEPTAEPEITESSSQKKNSHPCKCHGDHICEEHEKSIRVTTEKEQEPEFAEADVPSEFKRPQRPGKASRERKDGFRSEIHEFRMVLRDLVTRPAFGIISAIAIMINSISLLFLSHEMDPEMETFVNVTDKIFRYVFVIEIMVKLIGLGRDFFHNTYVVDFFIIMLNLIAGIRWDVKGISIMRLWLAITNLERAAFLRNLILLQKVIMNALASLVYLVLLLILTIYIFAVIGFNFFSKRGNSTSAVITMTDHDYYSPWTFRDFTHSLLVVFRILCGEWFLPFWECFKSTDKEIFLCSLFFFSSVICINIVLLNLILGVLLDCFDEAKLAEEAEEALREQTSVDEKASSVKASEVGIIESQSWSSSVLIPYLSLWLEKIKMFLEEDSSELAIIITIIISCLFQCLEDSRLEGHDGSTIVWLAAKLVYVSTSLIFLLETLIKLLVQGMSFKLNNWWNLMEIMLSGIFVLDVAVFRSRTIQAFRVIRTFRLLQPFTTQRRWRGILVSASVIIRSVTAVINVLIVVIYFWFVFSVIGVSLFRGKLFRCTRNRELLKVSEVANKSQCLQKGLLWENNPINFDDVPNAYLALFEVGTFEGWTEIMQVTSEARGINLQPEKTTSLASYGYFVVFIIIGVLIVLKLFVGVIVQHCDIVRRHADSGVRQLLTSQYMIKYYQAMKRIARRRPAVLAPRPTRHFESVMYDIITSSKYEKFIFITILLYLVFDVFIYFYDNVYKTLIIRIIKMIINYLFLFEVFVELSVYKLLHLQNMANCLDFFSVLLCAITTAFISPLDVFVVDPLLLRMCRVIKTDKAVFNVMPAKQLRRLFLTLHISLVSITKIAMLLVLFMYVYAVIGMNLFGISTEMSQVLNFNWIMPSMMYLFHLSTAAGWNTAFEEAIRNSTCSISGNCGQFYSATIYFSTYLVICSFVLLNMFVAIVLENFNETQESKDLGFEEEDLDVLYHMFSKQDPHGTGFIPVLQLSDFFSSLPDPFTINKPNKVTIIVLDIPVCKGIRVHFVDLCSALFTSMLGRTGEKVEQPLKKQLEPRFTKIYPERETMNVIGSTKSLKTYERTLRHPCESSPSKRDEIQSIAVIQRAWRYYHDRERKVAKQEVKTL